MCTSTNTSNISEGNSVSFLISNLHVMKGRKAGGVGRQRGEYGDHSGAARVSFDSFFSQEEGEI